MKAFTLVELAIVIVIIGLLVGGVLQGQELIAQAKQRNLISSINKYRVAVIAFKAKYNYLPGDYNKAVEYIGAESNGDGDTIVHSHHGGVGATVESQFVLDHLLKAKLINGTNVKSASASALMAYKSSLATPYSAIGIFFLGTRPTPTTWFNRLNPSRNHIQIGSMIDIGCCNDFLWGAAFNAETTYSIDKKIDDGRPYTGMVKSSANPFNWPTAYSTSNPHGDCVVIATQEYNTGVEKTGCNTYFELDI